MANTIGTIFKLTTFGESHGMAIGGVIDGCPSKIEINTDLIQHQVWRRRTGQGAFSSPRSETDKVEFLSGVFENKTLGTPIAFMIRNDDARSSDYDHLQQVYRPSHADFTYDAKYGIRDHRGGGRASARETVARVAAGSIASQVLQKSNIEIYAFVHQIGKVVLEKPFTELNLKEIDNFDFRCPDLETAKLMNEQIEAARLQLDSLGGAITCVIKNLPAGLGEPLYDKFHARLAAAMFSLPAIRGFEVGEGFHAPSLTGSTHNDSFFVENGKVRTKTNRSGGVLGGITNGEDMYFRVAFKPVSTIAKAQETITDKLESTVLEAHGRHDVCVVPRAVPIVEAMAALVTVDLMMLNAAGHCFD